MWPCLTHHCGEKVRLVEDVSRAWVVRHRILGGVSHKNILCASREVDQVIGVAGRQHRGTRKRSPRRGVSANTHFPFSRALASDGVVGSVAVADDGKRLIAC